MSNCIFCLPKRNELFKEIILENHSAIAVFDNFPVSPGHILIISKDHFENWFDAPLLVQTHMEDLVNAAHDWLTRHYQPEGFNVNTNCGKVAGQTVFHVHYHVVPRYAKSS